MATVLLISETKLKAYSTLNQNIDMSLLVSTIYLSQELGLQTLIGTKGYDYYMELVKSVQLSGGTMSQPDRIMLDDYIAPYLIHRAYYEAMPEVFARKMNKAITIGNTEQGTSIDIKGMSYLRDIEMGRYQFYAQRLLDRVQAFPSDYPWFYSYTDKDGMPSTSQTYFAGIHFGPGMRRPPRRNDWYRNLPYYQGPEYDACVNCN
jgi:hypothetical protein